MSEEVGKSSMSFCPHSYLNKFVVDPETMTNSMFVYNRYDLVKNLTEEDGEETIHKFMIELHDGTILTPNVFNARFSNGFLKAKP